MTMRALQGRSHYEVLDVSSEATLQEIERAYRIARATYHPDSVATYSVFSDRESAEILRRVDEAYTVLSDARMRREYDARLRRESAGEPTPARVVSPIPPDAPSRPEVPSIEIRALEPGGEPREVDRSPPSRRPREVQLEASLEDSLDPSDGVYDGPVLRRIRLSRGVELEEIAGVTKISELYLQFLEENRYHDLPAPVYVRGFVKEYAKCLRLDSARIANSYMERLLALREPQGRRA